MQQQQLPDTLSGLLEAAVDDARSLDRDLYLPNHVEWHCPDDYDHCEICLAGAVIAGRLNVRSYSESSPKEFAYATAMKLSAIDKMRTGHWRSAFDILHDYHPPVDPHLLFVELPAPDFPYFTDWEEFDMHLRSLDAIIPRLREIEQRLNLDTPDSPPGKDVALSVR